MMKQDTVLMQILQSEHSPSANYSNRENRVSLPMDFAFLPADILSKQFTKLNSPHSYRIHYLGPRFANTQVLHRKCSWQENSQFCQGVPDRPVHKYKIETSRVVNSFRAHEKLRSRTSHQTELYYRAFEGMNPTLDLTNSYVFNGAFESGNLDCVIEFKPKQFDCFLRVDSNTRGHSQWFYFSVENGKKKHKIRLNICNISKAGTLYETGMHPYFFSKQLHRRKNLNWSLGNSNLTNVTFSHKQYHYENVLSSKAVNRASYCLSFDYHFEEEDDQVFFAYCLPYTYSEMLHDIENLPKSCVFVHQLGRSLAGLPIPLLHITDGSVCNEEKKNVVITGRIHPGESNGSHVLKGFIDFICSSDKQAIQLRRRVNLYVIPMINPDGVVLGNSRSSAAGRDLNRVFTYANKQLYPEIFQLKYFIDQLLKKRPILLYFDYHGHSRKKNTFFYGPTYPISDPNYYKCRVLPKIIQRNNNAFRYHSCSFAISESKKATGRACMFQYYNIPYTFTVETSIGYFYDSEQLKTRAFGRESWAKMGRSICQGLSTFVQAYEEYQLFLTERRVLRQTKKQQKLPLGGKLIIGQKPAADEELEVEPSNKNNKILKLLYNGKSLFMNLLEEVKQSDSLVDSPGCSGKLERDQDSMIDIDVDISSDDHDENEDYSPTKLQQFQNYVANISRVSELNTHRRERKCQSLNRKGIENRKGTLHSNKPNQSNINLFTRSQNDEQEINLFEELTRKSQSPITKPRPTTIAENRSKALKIKNIRKLPQNNKLNLEMFDQEPMKKGLNVSLEDYVEQQRMKSARLNVDSSSRHGVSIVYSNRNKIESYKKTQFSQIKFPDNDLVLKDQRQMGKCLAQQSRNRTDLFRGIKRNRKCEEKAANSLRYQHSRQENCQEFKIIKSPIHQMHRLEADKQGPVSINIPPQHDNPMPRDNPQKDNQQAAKGSICVEDKQDKMQNKISQLMRSLENRSRILQHSIKCQQTTKPNTNIRHDIKYPFYYAARQQNTRKKICNDSSHRLTHNKRQSKDYRISSADEGQSVFRKSFEPMLFTIKNIVN